MREVRLDGWALSERGEEEALVMVFWIFGAVIACVREMVDCVRRRSTVDVARVGRLEKVESALLHISFDY